MKLVVLFLSILVDWINHLPSNWLKVRIISVFTRSDLIQMFSMRRWMSMIGYLLSFLPELAAAWPLVGGLKTTLCEKSVNYFWTCFIS